MAEKWKIATKELGLSEKELNRYSILNAAKSLYDPVGTSAQFERDLSEQICKRDNKETKGVLIPQEVLDHRYASYMPKSGHILTDQVVRGKRPPNNRTRAMQARGMNWTTNTQGGYLVDEELRTLIEVLVENTLALQNVPVLNVEGAPINIPGQTNRVQPQWTREDPITFEEIDFNDATTQAEVTALTSPAFALIVVSSVNYVAFKTPSADTDAKLTRLKENDTIKVGDNTWIVGAAYDKTAAHNRIAVDSAAVSTGLTDGTGYALFSDNKVDETVLTFNNVVFNPKYGKVLVNLSRTLRLLSSTDTEMFTRNDIAIGISKMIDTSVIYGTGTNSQPTGVSNTTGINSLTWNATTAYAQVVNARRLIEERNITTNNLKWLTSWYFPTEMMINKRLGAQTRRKIITDDGRVVGVPVEVTSQIPGTTAVPLEGYLGNWMESAITLWQDLEIQIDPYTLLHQGIDRIVGTLTMDFNVLRPKAFCRLGA